MIKKHFKKLIKTIGNSSFLRVFLCFLLSSIIKIIYKTVRFKYIGEENISQFWDKNEPLIITVWHGRLMFAPFFWKSKNPVKALISPHRDGLILTEIFKKFNIGIINGSSFKNPVRASVAIKNALKEKNSIAITPDGPRGPRMKLGKSPIYFAKISGVPIVPAIFSAKPCKILKSWDRFMLVYPFAKGVFIYDEPFYVPKDCDEEEMENLRIKLENKMITLQNKADKMMNLEIKE